MPDERTQFYLQEGWLTEDVARIIGMYEDGEWMQIISELEALDAQLHHLTTVKSAVVHFIDIITANPASDWGDRWKAFDELRSVVGVRLYD